MSALKEDSVVETRVEETQNENGDRFRVTRKVRVTRRTQMVPPAVLRRRALPKFGECAGKPAGIESGVTRVDDTYTLNLGFQVKSQKDQTTLDALRLFFAARERRLAERAGLGPKPDEAEKKPPMRADEPAAVADTTSGEKPALYVPPRLRGRIGDEGTDRQDAPTVRVTNLSEDATENDLRQLFMPFGNVVRVFLAKDQTTGRSRGFAFVSLSSEEAAQAAIAKLNGYAYDHLILRVEESRRDRDRERERERDRG